MKITRLIMLILWFIIGLLFMISPLPITKVEFSCTWISLLCFIGISILEADRR